MKRADLAIAEIDRHLADLAEQQQAVTTENATLDAADAIETALLIEANDAIARARQHLATARAAHTVASDGAQILQSKATVTAREQALETAKAEAMAQQQDHQDRLVARQAKRDALDSREQAIREQIATLRDNRVALVAARAEAWLDEGRAKLAEVEAQRLALTDEITDLEAKLAEAQAARNALPATLTPWKHGDLWREVRDAADRFPRYRRGDGMRTYLDWLARGGDGLGMNAWFLTQMELTALTHGSLPGRPSARDEILNNRRFLVDVATQ
jgi:chromosome segregation ATPase